MNDEIKNMCTDLPIDENTMTDKVADTDIGEEAGSAVDVSAEADADPIASECGDEAATIDENDGGVTFAKSDNTDEADEFTTDTAQDGEVTTVFALDDDTVADVPMEYTAEDDNVDSEDEAQPNEDTEDINEDDLTSAAMPEEDVDNAPRGNAYDPERPRGIDAIFDFVELLIFSLVAVLLATTFIFRHSVVEGPSMETTLFGGEHLIISDLFYTPERGDIIVCEDYTTKLRKPIVKRVIALPGDRVEILITGDVYVNGELLEEDYVYEDEETLYNHVDVIVPEGEIFVMGDHRNLSTDSREIGTVDMDSVLGKVLFRFYPFSRFGKVE
jgi:signal peptidase I